jgi:hypothetical protein
LKTLQGNLERQQKIDISKMQSDEKTDEADHEESIETIDADDKALKAKQSKLLDMLQKEL